MADNRAILEQIAQRDPSGGETEVTPQIMLNFGFSVLRQYGEDIYREYFHTAWAGKGETNV